MPPINDVPCNCNNLRTMILFALYLAVVLHNFDALDKIQALKKSVSKGDKKRKKDVATEIAKLEAEIESRHETELKRHLLLDAPPDDGNQGGVGVASIASATDEIELGEEGEGEEGAETQKKSKSKKKRVSINGPS